MSKRRSVSYSEAELDFIKANCVMPRKELHAAFVARFGRDDVGYDNIKSLCTRRKWNSGRTGRFDKGQVSWNKGKTGYMGANVTSFKKGLLPHNHKPVGSERITKDGYIQVKTCEPRTWELKHRVVYEQHFGKIAKTDVVTFIDNDILNCEPGNLMAMSRSQALFINRANLQQYTGEAKKTVAVLAQMNVTAANKVKGLKQ